jgi:hypothetical protein
MEVIGEHNPGVDRKRVSAAGDTDGIAELIDMPRQQITAVPLQEIDRKEVTLSRHAVAAVIGNRYLLPYPARSSRRQLRPAGHAAL